MSVEGFYSDPDDTTLGALGIDVGPHTGIFAASWSRESWALLDAAAFECKAEDSAARLHELLSGPGGFRVHAAGIEAFVARVKSVRLRGVAVARVMGQVNELTGIMAGYGIHCLARPAGTVKPWASDKRLEAAGLLAIARGAPHAKPGAADVIDAARHCLFSACQAGLPDPLSSLARGGSS